MSIRSDDTESPSAPPSSAADPTAATLLPDSPSSPPPSAADPEATLLPDSPSSSSPSEADPTAKRDLSDIKAPRDLVQLAGASPGRIAVPGHEILAELGRGGMGVVYQARQAKLGRVVALKMILTGAYASESDVDRFRTEAEAIARLQHPNIVQIHEVGEHEGLPFFSLEFCAGGSLEKKLAGTPMPPAAAASLVQKLARAMQAAHDKGVIHRDLKPANVLLTEDGTPKVTDFGLAKKLEEAGQTASGSVMGTPSYMAPEQAGGQTARMGPACDTYALGAILYQCLTGRPPFKAATLMETLQQVIADDPVPPTQLQSKTPRDLETICLKCLQKEPSRRYASAAALADDLGRFVEGHPVLARPVGTLERAAKWVRRNPALAGAIASVAAALLLGAAVSAWFAIDASHQADRARANEATAKDKEAAAKKSEADAIAARNDLKTANQDLARTADNLEATLARSFLRPLGLQGSDKPMTDPEWEALWELAANRRGRLGCRFVEEASRTPVTSRQLRDRAALALPAAVGLDAERRAEVEALLLAKMDDPALADDHKTDLALAASAWDGLSSSGAGATARRFCRAMTDERDRYTRSYLAAQGLSAVSARLDAKEAAAVSAEAATILVKAMKESKDPGALITLAQELSAVSARLDAKGAAAVSAAAATLLVPAMKESKDPPYLIPMTEALSAVSARMEARDAAIISAQAAPILVQAMKDAQAAKDATSMQSLAQGLSAVSARMEARDAAQAATLLVQAMKESKDPGVLQYLAYGLWAVSAGLDARDAAAISADAATILVQAMKEAKEPGALSLLAPGLSGVSARLDAKGAAILVQAMKESKDLYAVQCLAQGLSAVSARLDAKDAAQAATILGQAMKECKDPDALYSLAQGLSAVSAHMDAKDAAAVAAEAATILVQAMKESKDPDALGYPAAGLSAVSARLDAKDAAQAATVLIQAMKDSKNALALSSLAPGLSAVSARLDAKDAAEAATILLQAMKDNKDPGKFSWLACGLSAVSARLDAKGAAQAATIFPQAIRECKDPTALQLLARDELARGLSPLSARLEAKDAAQAAAYLLAMTKMSDPATLQDLAQFLSVLLSDYDPASPQTRGVHESIAVASLAGAGQPLSALAPLIPGAEPLPCRLSTQQLVELLKMPTCVGPIRRAVLDHLGNRYKRTFADAWEFVRFAKEQRLDDLDFTSPAQRPESAAPTR